MFQDSQTTQEEASLKVHRSRSVRRAEVTADGRNLVSHAGTALLCEFADRTRLTRGLSEAMTEQRFAVHGTNTARARIRCRLTVLAHYSRLGRPGVMNEPGRVGRSFQQGSEGRPQNGSSR